uniref:Pentatricopeptide repeat-containing protein n=2 Tax=Zea mays TaxID=4577 RepID=C0PB37_MAIZE|nr:unknown [Zea mays]
MAATSYLASFSRASPAPAAASACLCNVHAWPPALRPRPRRRRPRPAPLRVYAISDQDRLLTALREQADPEAALQMLNSALAREDFAPSRAVYEEIIQKLGTAGAFDLMEGLVREMRREGHEAGAGVVRSFVESYARLRRFDDAVDLVRNQLNTFGVQADTAVYNHLLNVLAEGSRMKLLESVYNEMTDRGIQPDVVTLNTLIKALCRAHQVRTAVLMLEEMSSHAVAPDETTFTTLMQGFIEEGSIEAALRVKTKMMETGCSPTRVTVNVLINGYCKMGQVEEEAHEEAQEEAQKDEAEIQVGRSRWIVDLMTCVGTYISSDALVCLWRDVNLPWCHGPPSVERLACTSVGHFSWF